MESLKIIIPIYLLLFIFGGFRNAKMFFLLTGIITMPFRTTYTLVDVGPYIGWTNGINICLSDISFICLFIYLVWKRKLFNGLSKNLMVPTYFFIGAIIVSFLKSTWLRVSVYEVILLVQVFFLYYVVMTAAIENEKELRFVITVLMISMIVQGAFAALQYWTGRDFDIFITGTPDSDYSDESGGLTRAVGTIGKPNGLAMYVVPILLLVSSLMMKGRVINHKLGALALGAGTLALLFSSSRGGWIAFLVSFTILLFSMTKGRMVRARVPLVALLIGVVLTISFYSIIQGRLASEEAEAATTDRIFLIKIAWNMIKDNPVLGIGANTFTSVIQNYTNTPDLQDIYLHMVHNQYLLVWAETGILGLVAFLWFLYACFREAFSCIAPRNSEFTRVIGISVAAGFLAMSTHMMVDMYSSALSLGLLFIFCGLCSAAKKIEADSALAKAA